MDKKIWLLLGPSGSGKTTFGLYMQELGIPEIISHTTRKPRVNKQGELIEFNGVNYYFVTLDEFNQVEMLENFPYADNWYGTSVKEVEDKLNNYGSAYAILNLDGVKLFKQKFGNLVKTIYIYCSPDILYQRMLDRGDLENEAHRRIKNLIDTGELNNIEYSDYVIRTDKHDLEFCKQMIKFIISEGN